jgi:hypothetical protein
MSAHPEPAGAGVTTDATTGFAAALPAIAREVEEFVATAGWDQPPQLFALVPTAELVAREPGIAGSVDAGAPLTPIAQDPMPGLRDDPTALDRALAQVSWPAGVAGCALAHEVLVLPPDAEESLPAGGSADEQQRAAAAHPARREVRLVAAVLRDGASECVLRLRATDAEPEHLVHGPDVAPGLVAALHATFQP